MCLGFSDKLQPSVEGPYPIERVFTDGVVNIRTSPNVVDQINIHRIKPRHRLRQLREAIADEEEHAADGDLVCVSCLMVRESETKTVVDSHKAMSPSDPSIVLTGILIIISQLYLL